uniref:hypothetical protein n=1 Tax=Alistipes sp. TaxID=1872444 RepID=UPI004055B437
MKQYILALCICTLLSACYELDSPPHIPAEVYPAETVSCAIGEEHLLSFTAAVPITLKSVSAVNADGINTLCYLYQDAEYLCCKKHGIEVRQRITGGAIEVKIEKNTPFSGYQIRTSIQDGLTDEKGWVYLAPLITIRME